MRRFLALLFLTALLAGATGCGMAGSDTVPVFTTVPTAAYAEAPTQLPSSTDRQLSVIWENRSLWEKEDLADAWCYAVTDLDSNGRLELVSSFTQGTGHFVTTRLFEVNADHTGLVSIENVNEYGENIILTSGYQSSGLESVPSFYDSATDTYYYIQRNTVKVSSLEYCEGTSAVSFRQGQLSRESLAFKTTSYSEGGVPLPDTYQNAAGESISEAEYASIAETLYQGMDVRVAYIRWLDCMDAEELTLDHLKASWEGFSNS